METGVVPHCVEVEPFLHIRFQDGWQDVEGGIFSAANTFCFSVIAMLKYL